MADIPKNQSYGSKDFNIGTITKAFQRAASSLGPRPNRRQVPTGNNIQPSPASYSALSGKVQSSAKNWGATVTVPYGSSTKYEAFHPGVDLAFAGDIGANIPSFAPGKVTEVVTGKKQGDPWSGNYIVVQDAQGNKFRYSHLSNSYVKVGQQVNRGDVIGAEGNSGYTYSPSGKGTGAHLDFRIKNAYNKYVDPRPYING